MKADDAIITPRKPQGLPPLGPVAAMVSGKDDLLGLCRRLGLSRNRTRSLFNSRAYYDTSDPGGPWVVGPMIGAAYAVMVLENMVAWGARRIVFWGWCGAIRAPLAIGDVVVPSGALIDEGTSRHYLLSSAGDTVTPSARLQQQTREALAAGGIDFHEGLIWTTDAVYRETPARVAHFRQRGALAVEMELSALFAVSRFREVDLAAILVVSDELATLKWRPGFQDIRFKKSRQAVTEVISALCRTA